MKTVICGPIVIYVLASLALHAEQRVTVGPPEKWKPTVREEWVRPERLATTPPEEFERSIKLMKAIFGAKTIGLELYSPLTLPDIKADETKESVLAKLQNAGFKVLEKDGVINVVDAKERPTGTIPYPFAQRVKIAAGTYHFRDLLNTIKEQTGFGINYSGYMTSFQPKWNILIYFLGDEAVSVREIMNRAASKADGIWVVERWSFGMYMATATGDVRTDHPMIRERDGGQLYLLETK